MSNLPVPAAAALALAYGPPAVALATIDMREHRLPNRLVTVLSAGVGGVLLVSAVLDPSARGTALIALALAVAVAVTGVLIALAAPDVLGMGDAKTAPAVVATCCALGWDVLIAGLCVVVLGAGLLAGVTAFRARSASVPVPLGPALLAAPIAGAVHAALGDGALVP